MSQAHEQLISFLLPEGILDYFELTAVGSDDGLLSVYLEEKTRCLKSYEVDLGQYN